MKTGDKVVLVKADAADELSGLVEGNVYVVQDPDDKGYVVIAEKLNTPHHIWKGWGPVNQDQIKRIITAAIVHDHLIRDDNYQYWSLSDEGWLLCVGAEVEDIPDEENGYHYIRDIQDAWTTLVEDGYINESD